MNRADRSSRLLETAILERVPGARHAYVEGEYAYVDMGDDQPVIRYRLSPDAKRVALLEREGRPLDILLGEISLVVP